MSNNADIIDIHCHTAGIGAGGSGCFVSPALRRSWRYRVYLKAFRVTEDELLREGDRLILSRISQLLAQSRRVSTAVILAMDGVVGENGRLNESGTEIYIPNRFVAEETRRHANLLFGASVNPYRPDALQRLEQAVEDGAVLLKWLPAIQQIDPSDQRLLPFYTRMRELGLPLLSHTGSEYSFTRARNDLADPDLLRLPLRVGVTVIAAHAASNGRNSGESNHIRLMRMLGEFPNLYADISALTQLNRLGHLTRLLNRTEFHDRFLYGTDMPLPDTGIVTPFAFPFRVSPPQMFAIWRFANPWDRDVALKEALGVTDPILRNSANFLKRNR